MLKGRVIFFTPSSALGAGFPVCEPPFFLLARFVAPEQQLSLCPRSGTWIALKSRTAPGSKEFLCL